MGYSFDGAEKVITLTSGTVVLDVKDLYSRWKDWTLTSDNSKWASAFQVTGGDEIDADAGTSIPLYAFLINGWRIKPQEANHTLAVTNGILLVSGGGDPFVNTVGNYNIRINYQQPAQAITVATGGLTSEQSDDLAAIKAMTDSVFDSGTNTVAADLTHINGVTSPVTNLEDDYDGTGYAKTNSTIGPIDYKSGSVNDASATTTSFNGNSGLSSVDNFYNGSVLAFTSGALQGKASRITDYTGSTRNFSFAEGFPVAPSNGSTFIIIGIIP
jgi:hypothetical protein